MARQQQGSDRYELEALEGLLPLAVRELTELGFGPLTTSSATSADFRSSLPLARVFGQLAGLKLAVAVHLLLDFDVPRPKALLGDQHLRRLVTSLKNVHRLGGHDGFRISAAGADSAVFQRLSQEISRQTGLKHDPEGGELLLRVRRQKNAWQVLIRLTDRPLSAREWRVCNREGGLNASIASAMNRLLVAGRDPAGSYLNAFCGSGTLLAEWLGEHRSASAAGFDLEPAAVDCARQNLSWAAPRVELFEGDASRLNLPGASQDFITADPPWGDDVGSHAGNAELYPAFLQEALRLLKPGGRLALLSHELKLTRRLLKDQAGFETVTELQVWHGGHRPVIWILQKRPGQE